MQDAPKRVLEQYSFFGDLAGADDALEVLPRRLAV